LIRAELLRVDGVDPGADSVPIVKHRRMAENPFRFLRGSAQLFYTDLSQGRFALPPELTEGPPLTTVIGDCHLSNFGFLTEEGAYEDHVVFCPNDYDDACMGRAVWDLARFVVSLPLAVDYTGGLLNGTYTAEDAEALDGLRAPKAASVERAAHAFVDAYRQTCKKLISDPKRRRMALDHFPKKHVLGDAYRKACKRAAGGKDFTRKSTLAKEVQFETQPLRFRERPERFARLDPERAQAIAYAFRPFVDDTILDLVRRLGAGTGSIDLDRYYLLVGPAQTLSPEDLPLCHVVEVKQQRPAAPLACYPDISPVNRLHAAHLTLDCQRQMQRTPDLVLDEAIWEDKAWLIRTRHHARVGIDPEDVALAKKRPGKCLRDFAKTCGQALALAHSRGDRRSTQFEAAMAAALKKKGEALVSRALDYASQVVEDQRRLQALVHMKEGN
jgi:uncharacterized protein (DUF2252 family)